MSKRDKLNSAPQTVAPSFGESADVPGGNGTREKRSVTAAYLIGHKFSITSVGDDST